MEIPHTPDQKPVTPAETLPPGAKPKRNPFCCPWFYLILLTCALIIGAFLYSDYRAAHPRSTPNATTQGDVPQIDTQASSISGNIEIKQAESNQTSSTTAENPTDSGREYSAYGSTVRLFKDESIWFSPDGKTDIIRLTAKDFSDSRCPVDAVCIWEGERGVDIEIVREGTEDAAFKLSLKTKTNLVQSAKGHTLTLIAIDDEKGGTYAEVKVE
ncbi:MAG: hypothetical protein RDU25_05140 [Patescibacteria group bacterium]|nr:hypothetical protein [Patescibacteria group bacterium]